MTYSALSVAKAFLDKATEEKISLSNMKLQKLVFFAHCVAVTALDRRLIKEDEAIVAWKYGPVIPRLYDRLKHYGNRQVTEIRKNEGDEITDFQEFDEGSKKAVDAVWAKYKDADALTLSTISHLDGSPWDTVWNKQNRKYAEIPDGLIKQYHQALAGKNQGDR
ncbi:MAG: DUF4065 domain-containing protein [Cardiobacteriaceae bacterium]|nr:DUF4065 domain-containing protein [Cardiobacteriaceae bacterium]